MASPKPRQNGAPTRGERARRTDVLLAELYELEEDAYRLSLRHAERLGQSASGVALRALVAHLNEALEEIRAKARARRVHLGSITALALDTLRRIREAVAGHGYVDEGALHTLRCGIGLARRLRAAAVEDDDALLVHWCDSWIGAREYLVDEAAPDLESSEAGHFLRRKWFAIAGG